jgi:hypothetical protein
LVLENVSLAEAQLLMLKQCDSFVRNRRWYNKSNVGVISEHDLIVAQAVILVF